MKKKDIIQLVKKLVKEDAYGSATLTTQGPPRTGAIAPTDEYPFSKRPKRTATGMMEAGPPNDPYFNALVKKAEEMGTHVNDLIKSLLKDKSEMEIVKMDYQDVAALAGVENLSESQGTLSSDMLNYADQYHMELVDTMKGVSTHPDKRTDGFYIKFPHENGPDGRGAMFGKETRLQIEKSKAAAKAAALKTYTKFQDSIEDYEISDSKSGVYGNVWLWVMPKDMNEMHDFEKKYGDKIKVDDFKNNPKLQQGKTVMYGGTKYKVLENTGYVLTLQSLESGKTKTVNLNQFISQGAIKEKNMKKIKEIGHMVTTKGGDTKYMDVDPKTAQKMKVDPNITDIDTVTGMQVKEEPNEGNAFGLAMQKAKEAGEDSFELNGKIFNVEEVEMDINEMINDYIKERGNDNLNEHVNKYRKRAVLMEGAMKQFFEMFDKGMTDEEVIQDYAQRGTQIPETFVGRARKQYEGLKKMKLELEMSEKEYKNSATKIVNNPMGMEAGEGMEEEKQLASGLFKENKK